MNRVVAFLLVGCVALFAVIGRAAEPELHARDGWPHVRALSAASTGEFRVAYFGGSITAAADGWRSLTTEHLRTLFPRLTVVEIVAGLPGTGSDLGAFRVGRDVITHRPDVVLVEFAVNDAKAPPAKIRLTMEGIVRQIRRAWPEADIGFVYTASVHGIADLLAGNFHAAARAMEEVAEHYGIPSVNFGVEVARRVEAKQLTFKAPEPEGVTPLFSRDGVHPTADGHRVYFDVMQRVLPQVLAVKAPAARRPLPAPLSADNWEHARLLTLDELRLAGDWSAVALDDAGLRGATKPLLPPTQRAATPGATVEFAFRGKKLGLTGVSGPDSGQFRVTVDDLPAVTGTFFDAAASPSFCRQREWFYPGELSDEVHRVKVELLAEPFDKVAIKQQAGSRIDAPEAFAMNRLTLCGALIVGTPETLP